MENSQKQNDEDEDRDILEINTETDFLNNI